MPARLVRVRRGGFEFNVGAAYAEVHGLEVLDEPTHDRSGSPRPTTRVKGRPVKPRKSIDALSAEKKAAESADQSDNPPSKE